MSELDRFVGMTVSQVEETLRKERALEDGERAIELIIREWNRATALNGPFNSAHEGYAVILEELDELKQEIWKKASKRNQQAMVKEAVQVGAMALRFLVDIALPGRGQVEKLKNSAQAQADE